MTKKTIENMAAYIAVMMDTSKDDPNRFRAIMRDCEQFFRLLFDLYAIPNYADVEKLRTTVFARAIEIYNEKKEVLTV